MGLANAGRAQERGASALAMNRPVESSRIYLFVDRGLRGEVEAIDIPHEWKGATGRLLSPKGFAFRIAQYCRVFRAIAFEQFLSALCWPPATIAFHCLGYADRGGARGKEAQ